MIVSTRSAGLGGLDLSLKPPKWLRNVVSAVTGNVKVTVPTPAGPINPLDPNAGKLLREAAANTTVTIGRQANAPAADVPSFVENQVPGGWLTVGAGALALVLLLAGKRR